MAIDQRIQTTVTAGRGSAQDSDGPIMVILLGCLAVAMCFTTLGMGLVNVAGSAQAARASAKNVKVLALAHPIEDPEAAVKRRQEILRKQILELAQRKQSLTGLEMAEKESVDQTARRLEAERAKLQQNRASLEMLNQQKQQLAARASELRTRLSGSSEEEQRQLELRTQLNLQLAQIRREIEQTDLKLQEMRAAIADKKNSLQLALLRPRDGKPTTWVECARGAIVLLPEGTRVTSTELVAGATSFKQAIQHRHVEFLVRPDGFHAFHVAREVAEQNGAASIGYEPVDADWRLK